MNIKGFVKKKISNWLNGLFHSCILASSMIYNEKNLLTTM